MKKRLLLLSLLLTVSIFPQQQDRFIIGAEHVSAMRRFDNSSLLPPHSDPFWNTVQEFGLNFAGLKYFQKYPVSSPTLGTVPYLKIVEDLDKAASRNIDVFLTNGFDRNPATGNPYYPKRWLYQVENVNGNNLNDFSNVTTGSTLNDQDIQTLTHWNLAPPPQGTHNILRLDPAQDPFGLVANNLREKNLQPDGLNYYVKVRMRLLGSTSFPFINVLTVRVKKAGGSVVSQTITANMLNNNNWQVVPVLCFNKTPNGPVYCIPNVDESTVYDFTDTLGTVQLENYSVKSTVAYTDYDIEIEWHNTSPYNYAVDLDYVAVDDETANRLYPPNSEFDARIEDFANNYKDNPAVQNFMVWDEARKENLFPISKIQSTLNNQGIGNKYPLSYRNFTNDPQPETKRFLHESGMQILLSDVYPIPTGFVIPGGGTYTNDLQSRLQAHLVSLLSDLILNSKNFNKPFWFTTQAHRWEQTGNMQQREPSAYEIKAMANLGVCYGAKGIIYYLYNHVSTDSTQIAGLYYDDINQPRYTDTYGYPKWETVKQLNQKLISIGYELMSLTWQSAFYINNGTQPSNTYITNVQSIGDIPESTYVQLGIFKKTDDQNNLNLEHFFVVNRRTMPTEQRNIQVTIDKSSSIFTNWKVTEVGTINTWTVNKTGSFQTSYEPAEGKLFKLEPVMIAGGNIVYNENIPSGTTLDITGTVTVNQGATLTLNYNSTFNFHSYNSLIVNGNLNAQNCSINFLTDSEMEPSSWGIRLENGSTSYLSSVTIDGARTGIFVNETYAHISSCTIRNCSYSGIDVYRSNYSTSQPFIYHNTIFNEPGMGNYGISLTYSSPSIRSNVIYNFSKGIYCLNNSSPYLVGDIPIPLPHLNNHIYNNQIGLYAYSSSNPNLGLPMYLAGGYNHINNYGYDIYAYNMCNIQACYNWWGFGGPNPANFFAGGKSFINYDFWLTEPPSDAPVSGDPMVEGENSNSNSKDNEEIIEIDSPTMNIMENILLAKRYINEEKYLRAINICRNIITEFPDTSLSFTALDLLWESGRKLSVPQLRTLLRYIYRTNNQNPLFANAGALLAGYQNNHIVLLDSIIANFSGNPIVESILYNKFLHCYHSLSDTTASRLVLNELDNLFPESESTINAHLIMNDIGDNLLHKLINNSLVNVIPIKYELYNNYPNPFNPSTTIKFDLPKDGLITLEIYDILGRRITTLVNEPRSAGSLNILWSFFQQVLKIFLCFVIHISF